MVAFGTLRPFGLRPGYAVTHKPKNGSMTQPWAAGELEKHRMFVLKNAWSALTHHIWRTVFMVVVAALVAFASVFGQAVLQANDSATGGTYAAQQATAVIRPKASALARRDGADAAWTKNYLSWNDYSAYATAAQKGGIQFAYSFAESVPVRQSGSMAAIPGSDSSAKPSATGGDLTLRSLYTADAAKSNDLGTFTLVEGKQLAYTGQDKSGVLVSQSLATKNKLKVGSEFTVGDATDTAKNYTFKVLGIYKYTDSAPEGYGSDAKLAKDNRDNVMYSSYYAFGVNGLDTSKAKGWSIPDLNVIFQLSNPADYAKFVKAAKATKIPAALSISSPSLDAYRRGIAPLGALAATMRIVMVAAWAAGGLLLAALVGLAIRRRRGEISTALIIGVSKPRIGWQLAVETLLPTLLGLAIGLLAAGFGSRALGAALAGAAATPAGAALVWRVIGWGACASLVLGFIASLRALLARSSSLFERRGDMVPAAESSPIGHSRSQPATQADSQEMTRTAAQTETNKPNRQGDAA
ncbi:FtsX-like permease family protein [Bifidobacterium sp.]|jgi:cell division protein FtsX|uniref:FtsX-like permease family protein n=1 Tax=Bifidobacterium sp. TaxID=41200 RepID=UPI0025C3762D|nr:FtsX-like permease family protein [Bifidobacterium sp.]MCH4209396.1 ABC transporter permease [Bifidobacterium sp.]MCI1224975.1 ABC transporter permease [Bifidobacterium sp.]